ncbi:MAG: hypothetical protein N2517_04405 [Ignavibacteria bacterium]|nr:hypothetical protein [Ignavibacteria bacterium]
MKTLLVELELETALNLRTCLAWGPRRTSNISAHEIKKAKEKNLLLFAWTLDKKDLLDDYLLRKNFDGILTNYPALVCCIHLCTKE